MLIFFIVFLLYISIPCSMFFFFFQAEDGIRDAQESRGLGDVYKRQVREKEEQLAFGVPEEALGGHAWHTYSLTSQDDAVQFEFKHNVCGRRTYCEGVADTVTFLKAHIDNKSEKKMFDMIDVLRAGDMN
eukprot:TRINITY_DN12549_c0_g1_i2.p1 TRINITY_DN12549_c0_g1~~TRINITY_DN12549_c0_g1_i2.p1  ORF type:complete len:130 (+),score=24.46 TRINITY_DN12549_c0_g1_i2:1-390(+)